MRAGDTRSAQPFGVRWDDDLAFLLSGRRLRVAFDVGAHRGETALRLLERFPGVEVHAFEPMPQNMAALCEATAGRGVHCVEAAVSDTEGRGQLGRGPDTSRGGFDIAGPTVDVQTVRLDDYAQRAGLDRIDLLKIDVEGHEPEVLRGASELFSRGRVAYLLCECEFTKRPKEPHGAFQDILALVEPYGFRVVSFYTGGIDDFGWRWGDVLLRRVTEMSPGWVMRSPCDERPPGVPPS